MRALAGIRVLDFGRVLAAPLSAQILGDLGAEVIKIERPRSGDDSRHYGTGTLASTTGAPSLQSSFFLSANRNKKSIVIDLTKEEGRALARELAMSADVLIENFVAGKMASFGLSYTDLRDLNPGLIYCSVTGYGQSGPYSRLPGYDGVFQAQSGMMTITGLPDGCPGGGPMKTGPSLVDVGTGYMAAIAILAALHQRNSTTGAGQHIDIALLDTAVAMQSHIIQDYFVTGKQPGRFGTSGNGGHPAGVFTCSDGLAYVSAGTQQHWEKLCRALNMELLIGDDRFRTLSARHHNRADIDEILNPIFERYDRAGLVKMLIEHGVPCAPINGYEDLLGDPHVIDRGIEVRIPGGDPSQPYVSLAASPIRMSSSCARYDMPPELGQNTDQILRDILNRSDQDIQDLRAGGVI